MAKTGSKIAGQLPRDTNSIAIQAGQSFETDDATGTPKTSPLAYSSSVITLTVPDRAVEFIVMPTTDLLVSDVANMATYDLVSANSKEAFPCAGQQYIYIKRSSGDGSAYFRFTIV